MSADRIRALGAALTAHAGDARVARMRAELDQIVEDLRETRALAVREIQQARREAGTAELGESLRGELDRTIVLHDGQPPAYAAGAVSFFTRSRAGGV